MKLSWKSLFSGSGAGLVATVPMSALMWVLHHYPREEHQDLPPEQITKKLARRFGLSPQMDEEQNHGATLATHFGFGGAAGAIYGALSDNFDAQNRVHPAIKGTIFGLLVWSVSYLGWIPATHILPSATEQTARRNTLMILAHVVWGATTGMLNSRWEK